MQKAEDNAPAFTKKIELSWAGAIATTVITQKDNHERN